MATREAFEKAYWDGHTADLAFEITNWSWLEDRHNRALIDGDKAILG